MLQEGKPMQERLSKEFEATSHETLDKYKPSLIGAGNEHFVFSIENHPGIVVKVNLESVERSLEWHQEHGGTADDFLLAASDTLDKKLDSYKEGMVLLNSHFDTKHIPRSKHVRFRIPVLPAILDKFGIAASPSIPNEIYVAALIQERVPELENGEYESLSAFYTNEPDDVFTQGCMKALFPSVFSENGKETFHDPEQKEVVQDFVTRAIRYSEQTGKILDVGGEDNVILCKRDGVWDYVLIDALFPATQHNFLERLRENVQKFLEDPESIDVKRQCAIVINSINYVRFINELASSLGIRERLDYLTVNETDLPKVELLITKSLEAWRLRKGPK